ncbi:hypothetical protein PA598K_05412 [Paenibacillus sp. 598K]|nr:hypothetical protein PA598K_05412 [Paenibacillus sp. 598K]
MGILLLLGVLAYTWLFWSNSKESYTLQFKQTVVVGLAEALLHKTGAYKKVDFEYTPDGHVDFDLIQRSRLLPKDAVIARGEDLFKGRIQDAAIQFSELTLVSYIDDGETGTKSKVRHFKGIGFIASVEPSFEGVTILQSHNAASRSKLARGFRKLSYLLPSVSLGVNQELAMEDPTFNETFVTRTSNEAEARALLTPGRMSELVRFRDKHNGRVDISFFDTHVCLLLGSSKNYFEAPLHREADSEHLHQLYEDICFFFSIASELGLDRRSHPPGTAPASVV